MFISKHLSHPTPEKVQQNISACLHFTFSALHLKTCQVMEGQVRVKRLAFRMVWPRQGLGRTGCPRNSSSTRQLLRRCLQRALPCTQNARAQWRGLYRAAKSRAHSGPVLWARNLLSALKLPYLQESQIHVGCHWFRHHTSSTMYNCTCTPADFSVGLYHLVTPSSSSTSSRLPPAAKRYIATSPHPEAALGHCLCQETSRNSYSAITCGVARGYLLVLLGSGGY